MEFLIFVLGIIHNPYCVLDVVGKRGSVWVCDRKYMLWEWIQDRSTR